MRRTEQEFRNEILRREQEYRTRQKQQRKKVLTTALCMVMVIFGGAMTMPFLGGMGGASAESAIAPMGAMNAAPAEAPAAGEKAGQSDGAMGYAMDIIPMVMIDGVLYADTGYYNGDTRKCGTFDGEITSEVDGSMEPYKNDQSNFGVGYGYQYGAVEGTVEICMNGKWRIFAAEEASTQFSE